MRKIQYEAVCCGGRLLRHDPQPDDPYLQTDIGQCEECNGEGCGVEPKKVVLKYSERFRCAIATLHVMLIHERFYEAKQIVGYELHWGEDPPPPGIEGGWGAVHHVLCKECSRRAI